MCMDSSVWLLYIQLIRVFLYQAQEETLYLSVTSDHAYHSNIKQNYSSELKKKKHGTYLHFLRQQVAVY